MRDQDKITIYNACEHNLRSITLELPKNKLIVVTGVSGSGKSSLIFDVLYREAENRYLGSFSSFARLFMGKMRKPDVERIDGLSPAIALDQKSVNSNPRSTVGTITGIYDLLRLLFARIGTTQTGEGAFKINRSLFSFNSPEGACPVCKGLGVEDFLDPQLLIADENLTLREGALVITTPTGYIIYSQVTMAVLDQVCQAEGFNVDIRWKDLTPAQKHIVLFGSDTIEIPYGKHPLESRMKWSGITAKPREMGYYKGILPVMETILQRDRNKNILRFVRSGPCRTCHGKRLNAKTLSVKVGGYSIADLSALQLDELDKVLGEIQFDPAKNSIAAPIVAKISKQTGLLCRLGLKYIAVNRDSATLSGGESQRLRLATMATLGLSGVIFIFDEPSIGLHPHETGQLIRILKEIRDCGNTVIVVEHDEAFIRHADWLTDIGPGPGVHGGEVLYNGPVESVAELSDAVISSSRTLGFLLGHEHIIAQSARRSDQGSIVVEGASANNLKEIDVRFRLQALNVVTGVSGAGKSSLIFNVLAAFLRAKHGEVNETINNYLKISGWESIGKLIEIDQKPIGRTPRSNPATYTGLFDLIRDLFAIQPEAKARGYDKGRFSFNTQGGRCENCQGAGYQQVGMHFMGNVEVLCEQCEGRRFDEQTLEIVFNGKNISEILDMPVSEAILFFRPETRILRYLETLEGLGLGYLTLGQRSSTLSGGEAQRIKLAAELAKPQSVHTLYLMDEPTTGLHNADVDTLLQAIEKLINQKHTVVLIEHHPGLIRAADHVIDLGPGSGRDGGKVVATGTPEEIMQCPESLTGKALLFTPSSFKIQSSKFKVHNSIFLKGVTTHNLRNINVEIPHNRITVLTGVSGSGKSSLAFDTIHAEAQNRFMEGFSAYVRSRAGMKEKAEFEEISGLTPTLALEQSAGNPNPRSTVGTATGIYDFYRLLFARLGDPSVDAGTGRNRVTSSLFSFNHQHGACPGCSGLGEQTMCDPSKLIAHPNQSVLDGALDGTKTGRFYGDPHGQYTATIKAVGERHGIDYLQPCSILTPGAMDLALHGTGDEMYEVTWEYKRDKRTGEHKFTGPWPGLLSLVKAEYVRKHADHRGEEMLNVMSVQPCSACNGSRLTWEALNYHVGGMDIARISDLPVTEAIRFFQMLPEFYDHQTDIAVVEALVPDIIRRLEVLSDLGLSYLAVSRSIYSLSGGEARRVRLASQVGAGLTGITYILDEPTNGLHPRDTANLMKHLWSLRDAGNTLIIVEHDRDVILAADHIIDLGPGAGVHGGLVVAAGPPEAIMNNPESLTGRYLRKPEFTRSSSPKEFKPGLKISGANIHNLKGFNLDVPSGAIVAVKGVSGSGKSSLVFDLIHASWLQERAVGCDEISGFDNFSRVVAVEQKTGFTQAFSVVATYTGIMDSIRDLFAHEPDSVAAGISKNHFSFLNKQGQCPHCEGHGVISTSMDFMPDVVTPCEHCRGNRYNEVVLKIRHREKNIAEILDLTVSDAVGFFHDKPGIRDVLHLLSRIGLAYLRLGQSLSSLSGGEAQRLYLAGEMQKPAKGPSLFLFDEPSAGLHFHDTSGLLTLFRDLADKGHSLLIIEHDPMIIARADHLVELGPEGGNSGGYLISSSWNSR